MRRPATLDLAIAAGVGVVGTLETLVPFGSRQGQGSARDTVAAVAAVAAALTLRRLSPVATAAAVTATLAGAMAVGHLYLLFYGQFVPLGIALYAVTRRERGRSAWLGAAAVASGLALAEWRFPELREPDERAFHWMVFAGVAAFGLVMQRYADRAAASTRRAIESEVAAAEQAMAAVARERTRIARELHDVVAHAMSVIVVQAGAAEQVVEDDPAFTRKALGAIRATGADALAEMRRVVTMLRDVDDSAGVTEAADAGGLGPQPGLDDLPGLVAQARDSGLQVSYAVLGTRRPLPAGAELAAYRIVQEALTNVRRHAHAQRAEVQLAYDAEGLTVSVRDDGAGVAAVAASAHGHGLTGMRERTAMFGGAVETRSAPGQGFEVRAVIPVAS